MKSKQPCNYLIGLEFMGVTEPSTIYAKTNGHSMRRVGY